MTMLKTAFNLGIELARREAGFEKTADDQLSDLIQKIENINWPWKKDDRSAFSTWKPYAAGAAAGLGAYGLMRHKFLADPKKYPLLRAVQEKAEGEMYHANIAGQPAHPKWYDRLYRSTTQGPEIWGNQPIPKSKSGAPVAVFNSPGWAEAGEHTFDPYALGMTGKKVEEFEARQHMFENKLRQAELLEKYAPGELARTLRIEDVLKKYNLRLGEETLSEDLPKLQGALRKEFGDKNYLLKTREVREGGDPMTTSVLESFPDQNTDLTKSYADWNKIRDEFHSMRQADTYEAMRAFRRDPAFQGRVVEELLHNNVIAQERLPIRQYKGRIAEDMKRRHFSPVEEYRVHALGGRASPHLAMPRNYSDLPHAVLGYAHTSRDAANYVQKNVLDKLPPEYRNMTMAIDAAPMEDGTWRLIELNPGMSGLLNRPGISPALYREVTGHSTQPVSVLGGLTAGGVGTGVAGAAMGPSKEKKTFKPPKFMG